MPAHYTDPSNPNSFTSFYPATINSNGTGCVGWSSVYLVLEVSVLQGAVSRALPGAGLLLLGGRGLRATLAQEWGLEGLGGSQGRLGLPRRALLGFAASLSLSPGGQRLAGGSLLLRWWTRIGSKSHLIGRGAPLLTLLANQSDLCVVLEVKGPARLLFHLACLLCSPRSHCPLQPCAPGRQGPVPTA